MFTWDVIVILLTGAAVAGSCALLGSFLVLRKMAMLGDAISHAVLPGIVIAFLITLSRGSLAMFIGAVVFGLLTTFLVQFLKDKGVQGDASIGVAFTFLFALGVLLISLYGQHVDLDLDCVLYGEIAYTPFDIILLGGMNFGPRPLWINAALFIINLVVIMLLYKQFKICAFDPGMAAAVGINVTAMHYLLMLMVSVTTVGAFESVGAILVVGMLIIPPATAYLLTDNLGKMLGLSVGVGVAMSVFGYYIARFTDASIAGSMATVGGLLFGLAFFFSPSHGVLSKVISRMTMRKQVLEEDALLWAWRRREQAAPEFGVTELAEGQGWSGIKAKSGIDRLLRGGFIERIKGLFHLSDSGRDRAVALMRRHRQYENYLEDIGYAKDHIHASADRVEHYITDEVAADVEQMVGEREVDPHGKAIPDK